MAASTFSDSSDEGDILPENYGMATASTLPEKESYFEPIKSVADPDPEIRPEHVFRFQSNNQAELSQIASVLSRTQSRRSSIKEKDFDRSRLSRSDTITGLEPNDARFDPEKPEFDFYLWARKFVRMAEESSFKLREAGFTFKDLNISGVGNALQLQQDVSSTFMAPFRFRESFSKGQEKHILHNFNGAVRAGELLIVLGRPGSGCSTFLKSICGELHGLSKGNSEIKYGGVSQEQFKKEFRGDAVYNQEQEKHFPHLTVGETLEFAAAARTPSMRVNDLSRKDYAHYMATVIMTLFGLSHTRNTKVGNDFVRGVSGGERKRVSIAEMALAGSAIAAWDNSTRGLDAATALEFVRSLRISADIGSITHAVAIYQASQSIYDIFDKAIVLYEGRQIYFGPTNRAKQYFETMGWYCPPRQTTGDFLTSVTNPQERLTREGYDGRVPRTPQDFERYWLQSPEHKDMMQEMEQVEKENATGEGTLQVFRERKQQAHAKHMRPDSPFTISIPMQIKLCTKRAYQRLWNDRTSTVTTIIGQSEYSKRLVVRPAH